LKNERYHHSLLRYTCFLFTKGLIFNSTASLDKKVKTIRDIVEIEQIQSGQNTLINQYTTPQLSSNPETNWMVNSSIEQRVWNFKLRFNASLSWFSYVQSMNNIFTKNTQNSQDISLGIRTVNKKWPVISLSYNKRYSTFGGITSSKMVSDIFECDYEISLHKNIIWTGNFLFLKNSNEGMISDYQILNTFLRYQKKTSPWILDLKLNNLFNNFRKSSTSFSDYSISNQTIYTLPRIFLLGVSYKI
jgi:hypothetical protein